MAFISSNPPPLPRRITDSKSISWKKTESKNGQTIYRGAYLANGKVHQLTILSNEQGLERKINEALTKYGLKDLSKFSGMNILTRIGDKQISLYVKKQTKFSDLVDKVKNFFKKTQVSSQSAHAEPCKNIPKSPHREIDEKQAENIANILTKMDEEGIK